MKKILWFSIIIVAAILVGCSNPTDSVSSGQFVDDAVVVEYNGKIAWAAPYDYFPKVAEHVIATGDSIMPGDVSGNGTITAFDATLVLRHVVRLDTIPDDLYHDVTGNGVLTAYDASFILTKVVNPDFVFPISQME